MTTFQELLNQFNEMDDEQKARFLGACIGSVNMQKEYITSMPIPSAKPSKSTLPTVENNRFQNGRVCPVCGSVHVVRNGHIKNDKDTQRYLCRDCGKSFVISSNSVVAKTHKDLNVWFQYIDCMLEHYSVRKSARICGIHRNTSFIWRHKILDALTEMQEQIKLHNIVEADETYFELSFKGNHSKQLDFDMGRKAHHRGKGADGTHWDNEKKKVVADKKKRGLSTNQVCVPCAVTRNGLSVAKIGKLGKVDKATLETILGNKLRNQSVLCTDSERAYRPFAETKEIKLVQIKDHETKNGIYHINTINNYHSRLKRFLEPFNGVATKYLDNYLVWFNYLNNTKGDDEYKLNALLNYIIRHPISITKREIPMRPAIPVI